MKTMRALPGVILFLLLAGCTSGNPNGDQGGPQGQPTRHDWASNSPIVIAANAVATHSFSAQGSIRVDYLYQNTGNNDAVDVGFVRQSDLAEYKAGQTVTTWAYQQNTLSTQQGAVLPTGEYAFVVHCRNSFQDCDGTYSLWATY